METFNPSFASSSFEICSFAFHKWILEGLFKYTLESVSLIPAIKKQMLATYYKFNAEEAVEKTILENRLHDIAKNVEKQKARLKNEEIPYHLYLEFLADFEKEKKEITDQLAKCSKGVVQRIGTSLQNCQFHTYWSKIKYLTSDSNVHCFN